MVFMKSTRYSCQILMKLQCSQKIFEQYTNIKFRENPSNGTRVVPCRRTGRHDEITVAFCNYANVPNVLKCEQD